MVYSFYLCNLLLSAVELPFPVMLVGTWLLYCKDLTNKYLVYIRLSTHCIGWTYSLQYNTWRSRCWYEPKQERNPNGEENRRSRHCFWREEVVILVGREEKSPFAEDKLPFLAVDLLWFFNERSCWSCGLLWQNFSPTIAEIQEDLTRFCWRRRKEENEKSHLFRSELTRSWKLWSGVAKEAEVAKKSTRSSPIVVVIKRNFHGRNFGHDGLPEALNDLAVRQHTPRSLKWSGSTRRIRD